MRLKLAKGCFRANETAQYSKIAYFEEEKNDSMYSLSYFSYFLHLFVKKNMLFLKRLWRPDRRKVKL